MKILKAPWKNDFLELATNAKETIRITSPYIKQNICSDLLNCLGSSVKLELITSFKISSIHAGALDIDSLKNIINSSGIVRNYPRLHSKIYIFDNKKVVISSGNLTNGGLVYNYEYGVYSDDISFVSEVVSDFNSLVGDEKTGLVKLDDIDLVREIIARLPKREKIRIPDIEIDSTGLSDDLIDIPTQTIEDVLSGWKLEVFKCLSLIEKQVFSLEEINQYIPLLARSYPNNNHIPDKIRQQLQVLRDLGLIEFLGNGWYRKLWT